MSANAASDDSYLQRLDTAISAKRARIRGALLATPVLAATLSALAFLTSHPGTSGARGTGSLTEVVRQWYRWSQGWASPAEAGTTSLGLLTAALTLYVATTLTTLDRRHTSADGVAARLLLDDVTLAVCMAGSVACWVLSAGAGWTPTSALGWTSAAAAAVVLALLGGCTETRQLYADRQRWALVRAEGALSERLGLTPGAPAIAAPAWIRVFPWRWAAVLAVCCALPAWIRVGFRFPHDPGGVVVAGVVIVAVWMIVLGATWSWISGLGAARVRYARALPSDSGATGVFVLLLVVLVAVATIDLGDEWGVLSLVLLTLAVAAPAVTGVGAGLRRRDLLRHLVAVRRALVEHPSTSTESTPADLASTAPTPRWSLELGGLRIQRFARPGADRG